MKSFHLNELAGFLGLFQKYTGAQLQEVTGNEKQLQIRFRLLNNYYLFFDLTATNPVLFWLKEEQKIKKKTTPLLLFLKKYFTDAILKDVGLVNGEGRVLHFYFQSKEYGELELETRLFPHGQNIIAKTSEKRISLHKPKDITYENTEISPVVDIEAIMLAKWLEYQQPKQKQKKDVDLKEKQTALIARLKKDLETYKLIDYKSAIQKIHDTQSFQDIEAQFIIEGLTWYELIEKLKEKDQKQWQKREALKARIVELETQLKEGKLPQVVPQNDLFTAAKAKGRVKVLSDGRRAYVGKSGKDNIELLRSAKAWYLWMHVRDLPGGHLILQQNKGQITSTEELTELANFLAKESGYAKSLREGDVFEVQYTECRYIKPIKGDKLGRVHVQKEKVLRVRFNN